MLMGLCGGKIVRIFVSEIKNKIKYIYEQINQFTRLC